VGPGHQKLLARMGEIASRVGLGRMTARIYALLVMSETPLSLDEMAQILGVSKASVSVDVRGLASIGAVRKVWAPETRRDLYEAEGDLIGVIRRWAESGLARRVEECGQVLDEAESFIAGEEASGHRPMPRARARIQRAKDLHAKLAGIVAMLSTVLGDDNGDREGR
jgi:DNA-binding transcriptional regulator GbsR (MarR family)